MVHNMTEPIITAIIPAKIDSEDRKKNVLTTIKFLLKHHNCNIILKEVDYVQKILLPEHPRLKYIFEQSEKNVPFHRTKIINDMLIQVDTPYTINYDCDMLLPHSTMDKCLHMLKNNYDLVFPYPKSSIYYTTVLNDYHRELFVNNSDTSYIDYLIDKYMIKNIDSHLWFFDDTNLDGVICTGGMQFFKTESYKKGFGENEEFIDWGPEDYERIYRFYILNYKIGWIDSGNIMHMDHQKSNSSHDTSKTKINNTKLWHNILVKIKNKDDMLKYMNSLKYTKRFSK